MSSSTPQVLINDTDVYVLCVVDRRTILMVSSPDESVDVNSARSVVKAMPEVDNVSYKVLRGVGTLMVNLRHRWPVGDQKLSMFTQRLHAAVNAAKDTKKSKRSKF